MSERGGRAATAFRPHRSALAPRGWTAGLVAWWLVAQGLVGSAHAQTDAPATTEREDDDRRARVHFESGRQYFDEGEYERAVEEFSRAYELSGRPALLMNVASGLERLGRYREAADRMQAYYDQAEDTVPTRDVLARRIANLRERAASAEAAAREPSDAPAPSSSLDASGAPAPTSSPDPSSGPPPVEAGVERGRGRLLGAGISFGVAGAGLVAFGVLGGLALAERNAIEGGCGATRSCSSREVSRLDGLALGADLGLAVAAAGVVAGVLVLVWMAPEDRDEARAVVVPFLGGEGGGALVRGRF